MRREFVDDWATESCALVGVYEGCCTAFVTRSFNWGLRLLGVVSCRFTCRRDYEMLPRIAAPGSELMYYSMPQGRLLLQQSTYAI